MISPPTTPSETNPSKKSSFSDLRGVKWRMDLGILPSSPSSTIDDFRRAVADSRRRYASLRHRLLVDPHLSKDGSESPNPIMDNPLSLNPDSMWGRYFRNAELEKMVDKDLSRLYPEHGSFFQTPTCQSLLRRVLLLWCLTHPQYGYRQGMHELMAPVVYVLHVDVLYISEVRKDYEDHFIDEFHETSPEIDEASNYRYTKNARRSYDGKAGFKEEVAPRHRRLEDLDHETREIILLSDAYGTEGELGMLLSERFLEHDAYCLFDALMDGGGVVNIAEFFSTSATGSSTSLLPVIEASLAIYHLLSLVDPSLHSHLLALEVEPQYFALRWLRILFGREFSLENLLIIWDELFSYSNSCYLDAESILHPNFKLLASARGAFIAAFAVSMILCIRSSLLATEITTSCLQKLLNFPENISLEKLIEKAKSLQRLAFDLVTPPPEGLADSNKSSNVRSQGSASPKTPLCLLPQSYWEERWSMLNSGENEDLNLMNGTKNDPISNVINAIYKGRLSISKTETEQSPTESMFDDFSQESQPSGHNTESQQDTFVNSGATTSSAAESSLGSHKNHAPDPQNSNINSNSFTSIHEKGPKAQDISGCENLRGETADKSVLDAGAAVKKSRSLKDKKLFPVKFQWPWKSLGRGAGDGKSEKDGTKYNKKAATMDIVHGVFPGSINSDTCQADGSIDVDNQEDVAGLRNLGQLMLEHIQVLESFHKPDQSSVGMEEQSNNNFTSNREAVATALKELREMSNFLLQM